MSESTDSDENIEKKIIVDEDWKSKVQAEKDTAKTEQESAKEDADQETKIDAEPKSAESEAEVAEESATENTAETDKAPIEFPPTTFSTILSMFASQAVIAMGHFPHPATGKPEQNLDEATYLIGLISVLEEKTKGNLDQQEEDHLTDILHQLRMGFVAAKNQTGK